MSKKWTFSHTETTKAKSGAIWLCWTSVSAWPEEDKNLTNAELVGKFEVGGKIVMQPKKGPKSKVILTEVTPYKSFTAEGKLPLGKLLISHSIQSGKKRNISFTHTITVTGPLRKIFVKLFVRNLANNLPKKMQNIARLAEAS